MGEIRPMPRLGDVFLDIRGDDRTMRVSYHAEEGVLVVSLWLGPLCRGSFRMSAGDVERLVATLGDMRTAGVSLATDGAAPGLSAVGPDVDSTRGAAATAETAESPTPSVEQTGEINRIADPSGPAFASVLRVA
jgi:hypothetical protein